MSAIDPLGHHELFVVIVQLLVLLAVARALGELFSAAGQPAVVGELLAGVLLGPSVLGVVAPSAYEALFAVSAQQFHLLEVVAWLGLLMLLVVTGLETDLDLVLARGRTALVLSVGGITVPFATGFALGWVLPATFVASPDQRLVFSLFVATAMSISAIPVIAKVLLELDALQRDVGQLILAAGMVDDTIGWILLATVAGLARRGVVDLGSAATTVLAVVAFLGVAFTVGRRAVDGVLRWVDNLGGGETAMITTLVVLALAAGAVTQYLGLEAILGAFVVGMLVGQVKRFDQSLRHTFEVVTLGVFAPIFFALAGLRMNLVTLLDPTVFAVSLVVLAVACFGKFAGIVAVSRPAGISRWEAVTIGGGMNARGAMEIVVATIGLGLGILTTEMYSIVVMVAVVTSLMAPAVMRWSLPKIELGDDERERLDRRRRRESSFVDGLDRVVIPTQCSAESQYAAQLVRYLMDDRELEVTNVYVERGPEPARDAPTVAAYWRRLLSWLGPDRESATDGGTGSVAGDARRCLDLMEFQLDPPSKRAVRGVVRRAGTSVTDTVVSEAAGYDLLVVGASERGGTPGGPLFSTDVDAVVQRSPCPLLVVTSEHEDGTGTILDDPDLDRVVLPTVGTEYSRHAAEVAFAVAAAANAIVEVVNVVRRPAASDRFTEAADVSDAVAIGEEIVDREADLGREMGATVKTRVAIAEDPEVEIVDLAAARDADLVVLGSNWRPLSRRAFLGHRVEYVVRNADCPVAVLSSR